jgi:predicted ATP-grasp superfamily ATP-dependent carboligase
MTDRPPIIVAAYSVRALASCAAHAGFAPLSIDVFGDDDMRAVSLSSVKLEGGLAGGLTLDKVAGAVEALISAHDPIGLVYGAGFEHQPETIAAIACKVRVFGNGAETLQRAKDPLVLARVCAEQGIRHPEVQFSAPGEPELWLVKKRGGAGGDHIAVAETPSRLRPDSYFQRRLAGRNISALFVASERQVEIVGLSMQWAAPTRASPFRYGGAAGPIDIEPRPAREIERCVAVIASEFDLIGLNSADFLVSDNAVWLLEINPRPGATLDVFESNEAPLFARHIAACEGCLTPASRSMTFKAAEIVYAPHDIVVRGQGNWPDWAVDRSPPGTLVAAGDPLCTTLGVGVTVDLAHACASERARRIVALVQEEGH